MVLKGLSKKRKKQLMIALIAVIVIAAFSVAVYARYVRTSNKAKNDFSPAHSVQPQVNESFENNIKENVSISVGNTDYPVYVRVALVFNWQIAGSDNGFLAFAEPKSGEDYSLTLAQNSNWVYSDPKTGGDGYYYYTKPVASGGSTEMLIKKCTQLQTYTDDQNNTYTVNLKIITQTVQAVGHTDDDSLLAVEDAWSWTPPYFEP